MKGRVTDNSGYDPNTVCSAVDEKNGTMCTHYSTEGFELLPATTVILTDFLRSSTIVQMLAILDPSIYYLTGSLSYSGSIIRVSFRNFWLGRKGAWHFHIQYPHKTLIKFCGF